MLELLYCSKYVCVKSSGTNRDWISSGTWGYDEDRVRTVRQGHEEEAGARSQEPSRTLTQIRERVNPVSRGRGTRKECVTGRGGGRCWRTEELFGGSWRKLRWDRPEPAGLRWEVWQEIKVPAAPPPPPPRAETSPADLTQAFDLTHQGPGRLKQRAEMFLLDQLLVYRGFYSKLYSHVRHHAWICMSRFSPVTQELDQHVQSHHSLELIYCKTAERSLFPVWTEWAGGS